MKKPQAPISDEGQFQFRPDGRRLLADLRQRAAAVSAEAQRITRDFDKGTGLGRIKSALAPLRDRLRELASLADELDALETSLSERIERDFLEIEASIRDALESRGWRVDGQWPKLYVERGIAIEFEQQDRSFKVSDRKIGDVTAAGKGRNQRRLAADAVAVMPKDRGADRPRRESNGVNRECLEGAGERVRFRKEQLGENKSGYDAVEEEIIPFDGRTDGRGNHGSPELPLVFGLRQRRQSNIDRGHASYW
jgi:hypothetical protein